jgi:hypothetical protein
MRHITIVALVLLPLMADAQATRDVSVYAVGGKSMTSWHGQAEVTALNIELARSLSPRTDVGFVFTPMTVRQPRSWFGNAYGDGNENVNALSGSLLVRRLFGTWHERLRLYAEGSTGPMWAQRRVPASTSRFNFVTQAGAGLILMPRSAMPLMVGVRFMHISNAGYAPRNPGLNVTSLVIGLRMRR